MIVDQLGDYRWGHDNNMMIIKHLLCNMWQGSFSAAVLQSRLQSGASQWLGRGQGILLCLASRPAAVTDPSDARKVKDCKTGWNSKGVSLVSFVEAHGGAWFAGDNLTFADFVAWELLDQHRLLIPGCLDKFARLQRWQMISANYLHFSNPLAQVYGEFRGSSKHKILSQRSPIQAIPDLELPREIRLFPAIKVNVSFDRISK